MKKKLLLVGLLSSFLYAEQIPEDRINSICSTKGYIKKYKSIKECVKVFKKRNSNERKENKIIKKSKNSDQLISNYKKEFGIGKDYKYYGMLPSIKEISMTEEKKKDNYIFKKAYELYLTKTYGNSKFSYFKNDKDLNEYFKKFTKLSFADKIKSKDIIGYIIRNKNLKSKIILDKYLKLNEFIRGEKYFKYKLFQEYLNGFKYLSNKENIKYVLIKLNKLYKNEKDLIFKVELYSIINYLNKKINKPKLKNSFKDLNLDKNLFKKISFNDLFLMLNSKGY